MLMKSVCLTLSTGRYTEATNIVVLPRTFFPYWFICGKLSFTLMDMPMNGESIGVVIGGFDPAALHTSTAVGDSILATPPRILPLDPTTLSSWLCRKTMCPRTILLLDPIIHLS